MRATRVRTMMSWATAFRIREYARASLWIVPMPGLLAGVLLAEAAQAAGDADWAPGNWRYSATTAGSVLSSVVGAMVALR
ncbi:hypothetical protein [Streptomyces poriticola]|uniref:hypothetical protein n=1 Tax=Streptomyces poriticola TaxID=3120506 RepID=UPI002FCDEC7A